MSKLSKSAQAKKDLFKSRVDNFVSRGIIYYDYDAGRYDIRWHSFQYKRKHAVALDIYATEFMIKFDDNSEVKYPYSKFDTDSLQYNPPK